MLLTQRRIPIISNDPKFLFDLKLELYFEIIGFSKFSRDIMEISCFGTHFGPKSLISELKVEDHV